jgi:hypothetical protein
MSVEFSGYPTGPVQWQSGRGGDGFFARIDPISGRMFQGGNSGNVFRCTTANCTLSGTSWGNISTGTMLADTQSFILPYEIFKGTPGNPGGLTTTDCAPQSCNHLIGGTVRVWENVTATGLNGTGGTATSLWYINSPNLTKGTLGNRSFINQLAYSPATWTLGIVGTNDGNVQVGRGLGAGTANSATWTNVTGGNSVLPNRPVLDVTMDPKSMNTATAPVIGYAAVGGFNANTPSTPGHVFKVTCDVNCASFTWEDKTGNLPDIPVDSIITNPNFPRQVFAGTDWGLYFTDNITAASPTWYRFENSGLPNVMIWDMQIDRGATTLSVWTRSRGAYVWQLPLGPLDPANRLEQTITFPAIADKVYGTADFAPGATASSGLAVSYTATGPCTIVSGKVHLTGVGTCEVTASQAGNVQYLPATDVVRSFTITKAPTAVVVAAASVQYSDPVTLTATVSPASIGSDVVTGTVEFFVDGTSVGSSAIDATGVATKTVVITAAPGSHNVTATFTSTNANFAGSTTAAPATLAVTQEDARATYNGNSLFWTSSVASNDATVTLSAAIRDITAVDPTLSPPNPDSYPGDIRNAKVTFVDRATGNPLAGCSNLPVGVVNAFDTKTGVATCSTTLSLGNGNPSGGAQFAIGIVVSGYYTRDSGADDTIVTVAQPIPTNFITGAGNLELTDSAGIYAGDAGSKSNFGFNVKYNKAGTNLHGQVLVIVRSGGHTYQVKGNAISSLGVQGDTAQFSGKASIQDVTDPAHTVSVDGNATLQLWMTDNGEPGSADTIGIQVLNKSGGVWYSSNWSGTNTVEQTLAGGNLAVHE